MIFVALGVGNLGSLSFIGKREGAVLDNLGFDGWIGSAFGSTDRGMCESLRWGSVISQRVMGTPPSISRALPPVYIHSHFWISLTES